MSSAADGCPVTPQCKNHCHGPPRAHPHSCRIARADEDLPVLPGPYPVVEDPSTCDIVKATQ